MQYIYSVAAMNYLTLRVNVGLNKTYIDTSLYIYYKILDLFVISVNCVKLPVELIIDNSNFIIYSNVTNVYFQ